MLWSYETSLTHNSPKYLEWNLAWEKLEGFFPLKYEISFKNVGIDKFQVSRGVVFF